MLLGDLNGKKVCILGYGKEGQAMHQILQKHEINATVTIADKNPHIQAAGVALQVGDQYLDNLDRFDVIIKSPGIPPEPRISAQKGCITNSTDLFLHEATTHGAFVIGVTGSKGKSTTSTLIYEILKAAGKDALLVGNIGEPAIMHIEDAKPGTIFVLEMSSYQLMDTTASPHIAVITSFFPEHLDYHGSVENYREAKMHITRFQTESDFVFFDALSSGAEDIAHASAGKRIAVHAEDFPMQLEAMQLKGEHNHRNAAIAFLVGRLFQIPEKIILPVIQSFKGLPHRLQFLGVIGGIEWVDDAISTTPESTIAALDAIGDGVQTIVLGGQDRGNDFSELGKRIARSQIKTVILFPGSGPRIRSAIEAAHASVQFIETTTMEEAVFAAKKNTDKGIVLLSTASPSYNMFKNFEAKGKEFKKWIAH